MKYICEDCKKETEKEPDKYSAWVRCECGGKAYEDGFISKGSYTYCRGGL